MKIPDYMAEPFFKTINYSSVNEDWRTETMGLQPEKDDDILCVTGSGARPLDLLVHDPKSVVAIDLNPAQNHLLQLKMAAIQHLTYDEYITFLGLHPAEGQWRLNLMDRLCSKLDAPCRNFWKKNLNIIHNGVLYEGRWEIYYKRVARLARFIRPGKIRKIFEFEELDKQRSFVQNQWDTAVWRFLYKVICHPLTSRIFLRDPAFHRYVQVPVSATLYNRMQRSLTTCLAKENFMIHLILQGELPKIDLPPHLQPEEFELIRSRLDAIKVVTDDLIEYLQHCPIESFSRFSLSDIPSFLSPAEFEQLLEGILHCSKPGSRIVIRQFLTRYTLPSHLDYSFQRDHDLEKTLAHKDRAFVYEFIVAEVNHD